MSITVKGLDPERTKDGVHQIFVALDKFKATAPEGFAVVAMALADIAVGLDVTYEELAAFLKGAYDGSKLLGTHFVAASPGGDA